MHSFKNVRLTVEYIPLKDAVGVEAQLLTPKSLNENRDYLIETIGRLQERLDSMTGETFRLQEELNVSKHCLEVCKHRDQIVVTAIADLFHVGKVRATSRSARLVGSMPLDMLRDMSKDRYGSRFGALGTMP
jgi:hypothetical protein